MLTTAMPSGMYLSCTIDVSPDYGGQTRALLMRNRILASEAGLRPSLLTFNAANDYDERRRICLERGLLIPEVALLNIYEYYREHGWDDSEASTEALEDLRPHLTAEERLLDGTPWRTTYKKPGTGQIVYDYLRQDGSPYLRIPDFTFKDESTWPSGIQRISEEGTVHGEFRSIGQWFRGWVKEFSEDEDRAFVFMDSRYIVPHLVPMKAPNIYLIYLLHNIHLQPPRRWDSPTTEVYGRLLQRVSGMDAMVTLTERQREDIAQRIGRTNNLFVVPNPVDMPPERSQHARDPNLATVVARLEPQKRLAQAVAAFADVVKEVPEARLDIFGAGGRDGSLQREIDRHELTGAVTLRGHDPLARDALSRSSAFLMTSAYEGYPLSTLESLSHGCPVVSYDIKYGPREQISDGVDGFLVPDGDTAQLAERVVRLLKSPDLVGRMSKAAVAKAEQHGTERFISDWAATLNAAVEQKPHRTNLSDVRLDVDRLEIESRSSFDRLRRRDEAPAFGRFATSDVLAFEGVLRTQVKRKGKLGAARVELTAVNRASGSVVELPLEVRRDGGDFHISSRARLDTIIDDAETAESAQLRLRLVWANAVWHTYVSRPVSGSSGLEVSYDSEGALTVTRPASSVATGPAGE